MSRYSPEGGWWPWLATSQSSSDGHRSTSAAGHVKPLGEVRRIVWLATSQSLSDGHHSTSAAGYVKPLSQVRRIATARNLPVFIRRAPLDIRPQSYEATRQGEKNCCGLQAPIYIRGRCLCKGTHRREDGGRGSQPPSLLLTGAARHPPPVM